MPWGECVGLDGKRQDLTPARVTPARDPSSMDAALLVRLVRSVSLPTAAVSVMSRWAFSVRFSLATTRLPMRLMSPVSAAVPVAVRVGQRARLDPRA